MKAVYTSVVTLALALLARGAEASLSYAWRLPSVPCYDANTSVAVAPLQGGAVVEEIEGTLRAEKHAEEPIYGVTDAFAAFPMDRSAPQYWLGDELLPPGDNVDWEATEAGLTGRDTLYVVDPATAKIYAVRGGTITITWQMREADGSLSAQEVNYQVSSVASGRPLRLFWTNPPYNGPTVSFSKKYVRLLGIEAPETTVDEVSKTTTVTHGVYVDENTMLLNVIQGDLATHPMLTGQMVVAYYDSGLYDRLLGLVVVEIAAPNPIDRVANVGEAVTPYGSGHSAEGLFPFPEYIQSTDNRGDYYYQHQGTHSYSPKHMNVYPLRPTEALSTRLQVWWKEYDLFGTLWPFELCRYQCEWGSNAITFVRGPSGEDPGLPLLYDSELTAVLQNYQEPEGHATQIEGETYSFSTKMIEGGGEHYSLLKFTGEDNVWFLPVHSIACDDPNYFTGEAEPWLVGDELLPRGGSAMATASNYAPEVDLSVAGYLYTPHSGTHYNTEAYYATDLSPEGQAQVHAYPSAIFPVNVDPKGRPLEVWWSSRWQPEGMTVPVTYPSLAQSYAIRWPTRLEAPRIVLASQLGSAMESSFATGKAIHFDRASSTLSLPAIRAFPEEKGTIAFWVRLNESTSGRLLTLASKGGAFKIAVSVEGAHLNVDMHGLTLQSEELSLADWHRVILRFDATQTTLTVDGKCVTEKPPTLTDCTRTLDASALGAVAGQSAPVGVDLDAVTVWMSAPTDPEMDPARGAPGLILQLAFDGDDELQPTATNQRLAREQVSGLALTTVDMLTCQPGAPQKGRGIILSDTEPKVYAQNDSTLPGYNPNEEHAVIYPGEGGYVVWAIRDDLNTEATSACGVLVSYTQGGEQKMRWFGVERTDENYPELKGSTQAGTILPGPHPLDFLTGFWNEKNSWQASAKAPFRDRKNQIWSVCADTFEISLWYPFQEGFYCPDQKVQPNVGDLLPWLDGEKNSAGTWNYDECPTAWKWTVSWPDVPTMELAKTLTVAEDGLPEVWAAKSMAIVWPFGAEADSIARLYDPTVMQTAGLDYPSVQEFINAAGIDISEKGNAQYRNGSYTLRDLPPTIAERFTIDPNRSVDKALGLIGEREETLASTPLLYVNVLSDVEREALRNALDFAPTELQSVWKAAIDDLASAPVYPNTYDTEARKVTYAPVDHYALISVGGTGYVTLIENDSTDTKVVKEGDPISMHIIKIVPKLAAAPLAVREDPTNLLSQQLSILYGESFAGCSNDFIFEWRKRLPDSTGVVPMNFDSYSTVSAPKSGETQLLIGAAGDSLENMVNTYYAVRYRPVEGTVPYATMKAEAEKTGALTSPDDERMWSAWSGPTLAEGWIQRVLNNITPFTQQMTDLYTKEAETVTTMLQKAGGPYNGDVALNQDNLTNVGLIQLYMTLFSKAESLSIANGPTLAAANDQLLLAATRAADLYMLLGNEAYSDALNPTIGFGSSFSTETVPGLTWDAGALATRLFCFDNQVSTLLDEELALLRGRAADYQTNGLLRVSPYYNRLPWNYTRGVTAGEVAYAVNYNISATKSSSVDLEAAAAQFPQGHGDAYGHFLSALKLYYRLLRNPNFSWGTPGMGEMLLGDAVINVDYYDENRFGEIAERLAESARATFDRTARKAYSDNGGAAGSGYIDRDPNRGFGYGEWASKAGLGSLYNWAVGNSLLPEAPDPAYYNQATFTKGEYQTGFYATLPETCIASKRAEDGITWEPFTAEFQVLLQPEQGLLDATLFAWQTDTLTLALKVDAARNLFIEVVPAGQESTVTPVTTLPAEERILLALGRESTGGLTLRVLSTAGVPLVEPIVLADHDLVGGSLCMGSALKGTLYEIRWWKTWRSDEQLARHCDVVASNSESLLIYLRTFTRERAPSFLSDEACRMDWSVVDATWEDFASGSMDLAFADQGLNKIDRASASSLDALTRTMEEVQRTLDRLDLGLNPLGLSENAVPFDITPLGVEDGTSSHFEQILARAEIAVSNAAAILDDAQESANRLRQLEEASIELEDRLDMQELTFEGDLIGYYGTPYTDDIGPSGLYAQGYTGADYYHYMYMDLEAYGLTNNVTNETHTVYHTYTLNSADYSKLTTAKFEIVGSDQIRIPYTVSNDGFVMKDKNFTGTRQAVGKLQQAYADALVEYVTFEEAKRNLERRASTLDGTIANVESVYKFHKDYFVTWEVLSGLKMAAQDTLKVIALIDTSCQATTAISAFAARSAADAASVWVIGGVAAGTNAAEVAANGVADAAISPIQISSTISNTAYKNAQTVVDCLTMAFDQTLELYAKDVELVDKLNSLRSGIFEAIANYYDAVTELREAAARLTTATQTFSALRSEAETIRDQRELTRQQAVNALTRLRYNDMFFRQVRNESLARYEKAFETAQRYVYLAAQAYGYETASSLDELRARIVATRTLGAFDAKDNPLPGSNNSDGGLAGILAEMKADWLATKSELGINNPQAEVTWFSLRRELLRIRPDASGEQAWRDALQKYVVSDLREHQWYRRYCQPFDKGGDVEEPALVIPFESTIEFAENFFGQPLSAGDSNFNNTFFSTRISAAGIHFRGYSATDSTLAATPTAYLIPIGNDYFRRPGGDADDVVRCTVVDQVVPRPYNVTDTQNATLSYDGYTGGADRGLRIRRYPSFRASFGEEERPAEGDAALRASRLIGRSAWNDQWVLIIPFGAMNADRSAAMDAFINGYDRDHDGTIDSPGVQDIIIGLRTYSYFNY